MMAAEALSVGSVSIIPLFPLNIAKDRQLNSLRYSDEVA